MQQHPVPQQISSYQFHLVGDMTLKQFLQVAGGVVVGLLFYATNLPSIIKWPLIIASGAIGAALAFLPFEERPLEQWIVAFFRSIYSPTLYYWNKPQTPALTFQPETASQSAVTPIPPSTKIPFLKNLEEKENSFLNSLSQLFTPTKTIPSQPTTPNIPSPTTPEPISTLPTNISLPTAAPPPTTGSFTIDEKPAIQPLTPSVRVATTPLVQIPKTTPVYVAPSSQKPSLVIDETFGQKQTVHQTLTPQPTDTSQQAQFSESAAPSPPTIPNTIVGQVLDENRKIIEGAILEITDEAGRPVRAIKSNKAGHFLTATPLSNGTYQLLTEKEGLNFKPVSFQAKGEIIPPIAVLGKQNPSAVNVQEL